MKEYFLKLYRYNHWANERYLDVFKKLPHIPERAHLLMSHTLTAQKLWLKRIVGDRDIDSINIWEILPLTDLDRISQENNINWLSYLENNSEEEFNRILSYVNYQKLPYNTVISDIIIHTANHATYHRAQYAILLRQNGIDPPNTDFITYSRVITNQL
jgi:uncharacterized damage-inducible protein DinB